MKMLRRLAPGALVLVASAAPVAAQDGSAAATGVRKELIAHLEDAEKKFVALAEATPQDKMSWRPAEGVRSVSEVFAHIGLANFMIARATGTKKDFGVKFTRETEKTMTNKAELVDLMKKSFAYAKQAALDVPESELDTSVQLFGQPNTKRGVLVLLTTHAHEHLGQAIAYARTNGVTPPWSQGG